MNRQSGSALMILLITIGLFGALAYAFTQSSRGNTSMMTGEQAKSYATQILDYTNDMQQAVKRMHLRGVPDNAFGFANNVYKLNNGTLINPPTSNPNCTTDSCQIFTIAGGGVQPQYISSAAVVAGTNPTDVKAGAWTLNQSSIQDIGTSSQDLVIVASHISLNVCLKINDAVDVTNPNGKPPLIQTNGLTGFVGVYDATATVPSAELQGKTRFCYEVGSGTGDYIFAQAVILPR